METLNLSKVQDCGTKRYFEFNVPKGKDGKKIIFNLKGRVLDNGNIIEPNDESYLGKKIKLRSALYCQARDGICKTCYNPLAAEELKMIHGSKVGQMSVASLAESLVNLTLKASHVGLSLDTEEIDLTKDVELFCK
jgi:hypothetical protein